MGSIYHEVVRVGPDPKTGGNLDTDTEARWPCDHRGGAWRGAPTREGLSLVSPRHQELSKSKKGLSLRGFRESMLC